MLEPGVEAAGQVLGSGVGAVVTGLRRASAGPSSHAPPTLLPKMAVNGGQQREMAADSEGR